MAQGLFIRNKKKLQRISSLMLSFKNSFTCLLVMCSTFDCVGEWDSNSCKGHITGHMTKSMTYSHRNKKLQKVWVHGLHKSQQTKISTLPIYVQGYESRGSYFNPYSYKQVNLCYSHLKWVQWVKKKINANSLAIFPKTKLLFTKYLDKECFGLT